MSWCEYNAGVQSPIFLHVHSLVLEVHAWFRGGCIDNCIHPDQIPFDHRTTRGLKACKLTFFFVKVAQVQMNLTNASELVIIPRVLKS